MITSSKSVALMAAVLIVGALAFAPAAAFAQTAATMPTFYNASGQTVNVGTATALPAGYYFLSPGGQQVYYYGNGTFYNPATGMYGGSVANPNGLSGVTLGYSTVVGDTSYVAANTYPGVPNTGMGGEALATWITLGLSAAVVFSGAAYLVATRRHAGSR